jgi:hypothetical protein
MPVYEGHLLPLLTCKDAARLGSTCKALRGWCASTSRLWTVSKGRG